MLGLGKRTDKAKRGRKSTALTSSTPEPEVQGPSPDPATNLVIADIMLRGAGTLARHGVERALLGRNYSPDKAKDLLEGRTLRQTIVGAALARVATRSVPGAIVVGGGIVAKTLYDRHRGKQATRDGDKALAKQVKRGK